MLSVVVVKVAKLTEGVIVVIDVVVAIVIIITSRMIAHITAIPTQVTLIIAAIDIATYPIDTHITTTTTPPAPISTATHKLLPLINPKISKTPAHTPHPNVLKHPTSPTKPPHPLERRKLRRVHQGVLVVVVMRVLLLLLLVKHVRVGVVVVSAWVEHGHADGVGGVDRSGVCSLHAAHQWVAHQGGRLEHVVVE